MSEIAQKIFNNIVKNDEKEAVDAFGEGIREKLDDAYEVRKAKLAADMYNTNPEDENDN